MKKFLEINVLDAAKQRVKIVFDNFEKIYISFSGGKDSSVMTHLVMNEAIKRQRKVGLMFIDLEGQYKMTIEHIHEIINEYKEYLELYWICLPIALRNAVSVYQPKWQCWNPDEKKIWVRNPPKEAITDQKYFPFFRRDMEFEDFTVDFAKWYSKGKKTACFIGIRTDESLNRYRTIKTLKKKMFNGYGWTTQLWESNVYNIYPIYDWKTRDIWIYNSKYKKKYNQLYDIMHKAGLSIHQQRICQPYGDDQRKGLWLFHVIEPETWSKIVARVSGANSGAEFVKYSGNASGQIKISKPNNLSWKKFCEVLLCSMPDNIRDHYENKIYKFIEWHKKNGWTDLNQIRRFDCPDEADHKAEASRKSPSWRRIAKMLLRNDYWAKGLSFSQTKDGFFYKKYMERVKKERLARQKKIWATKGDKRAFI